MVIFVCVGQNLACSGQLVWIIFFLREIWYIQKVVKVRGIENLVKINWKINLGTDSMFGSLTFHNFTTLSMRHCFGNR